MARKRPQATLVDRLVGAIEPALIMVMVSGLMLFLLDVWYQGPVPERMRWILFWFVFGIVLITRVSMEIGGQQAKGYGLLLGGAVGLVVMSFGGFWPFIFLVMGIVWWATHKLTYDCTLLDEDQDAGVGLLQESGLDRSALADGGEGETEAGSSEHRFDDPEEMDTSLMPDRPKRKFWEKSKGGVDRPHCAGGLADLFHRCLDPAVRAGTVVRAVGAGGAADVAVVLLPGLPGQRDGAVAVDQLPEPEALPAACKLKMPGAMTAMWLSTGALMITGLTVAAALLPVQLTRLGARRGSSSQSDQLSASNYAMLKDSGVQGDGAQSEGEAASKSQGPPESQGKAEGSGKTNDPNASKQTNGDGREGGSGGQGRSKSGAAKGKPGASQGGQQGKSGGQNDQAGERSKGRDSSGEPSKGKAQDGRSNDQAEGKSKSEGGDRKDGSQEGEKSSSESQKSDDSSSQSFKPPSLPQFGLDWLRTPILVVGIAVGIFGLIRYHRDLIQVIRALIMSLLALFGFGWRTEREGRAAKEEEPPAPPPRPFSSYANPFDSGLVHQLSPDALVVYSFEALEAWAYEREMPRCAARNAVGVRQPNRRGAARAGTGRREAGRVFRSPGLRATRVPREVLEPLEQYWRALEAAAWSAPATSAAS